MYVHICTYTYICICIYIYIYILLIHRQHIHDTTGDIQKQTDGNDVQVIDTLDFEVMSESLT